MLDLFPGRAKSSDILVILTLLYSLETYLKKIDQVAPHRFMSDESVFSRIKRIFVLKGSICSSFSSQLSAFFVAISAEAWIVTAI